MPMISRFREDLVTRGPTKFAMVDFLGEEMTVQFGSERFGAFPAT